MIGGGQLYVEALPLADELLLTEIDAEIEGDTLFPPWERAAFEEVSREEHVSGTASVRVRHLRAQGSGFSLTSVLGWRRNLRPGSG